MKTSHMLVAAALALTASLSNAAGTLGSGPMAAIAPSRVDSSAGSVMGPAESSTVDPNAPTKPGSSPATIKPDSDGTVNGGVAGGFAAEKNSSDSAGSKDESAAAKPNATTAAPSATPAPTKSGAASISAVSVVTVFSIASTVAALAW